MPLSFIKQLDSGATLGLWELSEPLAELESALQSVIGTAAYEKLNHELRKREWLGARVLMKAMDLSTELSYTEHGKPFYPRGPKISLTHSRDYIAIITHPKNEVGIDVQEIVEKVARIKHKFCNEKELSWAKSKEDFTLIWSAKEAVFKIKEKDIHFKEDILVEKGEHALSVTFKGEQKLKGETLELNGYQCVFCVE